MSNLFPAENNEISESEKFLSSKFVKNARPNKNCRERHLPRQFFKKKEKTEKNAYSAFAAVSPAMRP